MWTLIHRVRCARRGVAAVEFALTFPIMLYLFSGVTDLGFAYFREVALSNAVSAAAQFAEVTDQDTMQLAGNNPQSQGTTVHATDIETALRNAAAQTMPGVTVTPQVACYSVSVSATSWPTNNTSAIPCDGTTCVTSATTIKYVEINLSTVYNGLLPFWSKVESPTLSQTTWVPLAC
ncbi:MAG TPA: TadE/TadG family type IV pilus assembly protein [Acetobacteraceae bacterium]|jgi:Flp pilus assembly protein TadG|nr:TadE/TadG family type IV pilus assembly protein [Acetobacteraceae bacterium]